MNGRLRSVNLLEVGFVWVELIMPYVFFLVATSFLMICISSIYYSNSNSCYIIKKNKITYDFSILCLAILVIVFSAFRIIESNKGGVFVDHGQLLIYPGGVDAPQYKRFFEIAEANSLGTYFRKVKIEPIYNCSCWLFSHIFHNYSIFLAFYYLLYVLCLVKYCKMFEFTFKFSDFLCLFCIMSLFLQGFNTFRCSTAIFLSIFVLDKLMKNDIKKATFYILIICGIHLSAMVLFIPVLGLEIYNRFVCHEKNKTFIYYIVFLIFLMGAMVFILPIIVGNSHYSMYMNSNGAVSKVWILTYCFMIFQIYIKRKRFFLSIANKRLFIISLCFIPIFILQIKYEIAYRFMLYSKPIVYLILHESSRIKTRNIFYILLNKVNDLIFIGILITFASVQIISVGLPYRSYLF